MIARSETIADAFSEIEKQFPESSIQRKTLNHIRENFRIDSLEISMNYEGLECTIGYSDRYGIIEGSVKITNSIIQLE